MPYHTFTKYCLRKDCEKTLRYRNAEVVLETIPFPKFGIGTHDYWVFRARRLGETADPVCMIHETRGGRYRLETELFQEGFIVPDDTPAARILQRLVSDGYARSTRADSRDTKAFRH